MISNRRFICLSIISFCLMTISVHASEKSKKKRNPYYSPHYARECYFQTGMGSLLSFCGVSLIKKGGLPDKTMGRLAIASGLAFYALTYLSYRRNKEFMKPYLKE